MNKIKHIQRSARCISRLAFIVILMLAAKDTMAITIPPQDSLDRTFTVAKVYPVKYSDPGSSQVTFYESARFYKLLQTNPRYAVYLGILKTAAKDHQPVKVRLTEAGGNIIDSVYVIPKPPVRH